MKNLEVAEHIRNVILKSEELTKKELEALDIAQMIFDPRCENCKYHEYVKTLKGKKKDYPMYKCKNLSSPYRMAYTKDFITCDQWARILVKSEQKKQNKEKRINEQNI